MNVLTAIKGWWQRMFNTDIKKQFGVTGIESNDMRDAISMWMKIYQNIAPWVDSDNGIKSIEFAKKICEETAKLVCLDIGVEFDGKRKQAMTDFWDKSVNPRLRDWVEYGIATGSLILKPNGDGVDFITPDRFQIVETDGNGNIRGIVFQDTYRDENKFITKLEYHSFWTANVRQIGSDKYVPTTYYKIVNKAFMSKNSSELGTEISLAQTKWNKLQPETYITKQNDDQLSGMLFGYFKMPIANNIDLDSPLGMSIFSSAIEELADLDVAYSRNSEEIYDSGKIVLLDDRLTDASFQDRKGDRHRVRIPLPKFVKNVRNDEPNKFYQEIVPTLNTAVRKEGIDHYLSLIGCKCGYSNGYFVLDQKTGMITATQVESDDRETIQTVKDIRDKLKTCLEELFYAQSVFMDLYELAPVGEFKPSFNFGDITYSYEEDKQTWLKYVQMGKVPFWVYLVKFEGMSEEEAKKIQAESKEENMDLLQAE